MNIKEAIKELEDLKVAHIKSFAAYNAASIVEGDALDAYEDAVKVTGIAYDAHVRNCNKLSDAERKYL